MNTLENLCLLVGQKDSLFKQLVASLVRDLTTNLKLYESQATEYEDLVDEISKVKPDMILLDDASPFSVDSVLVRLLINHTNLPVIVISAESNEMHIVQRKTELLTSSNDLIRVIDQNQLDA